MIFCTKLQFALSSAVKPYNSVTDDELKKSFSCKALSRAPDQTMFSSPKVTTKVKSTKTFIYWYNQRALFYCTLNFEWEGSNRVCQTAFPSESQCDETFDKKETCDRITYMCTSNATELTEHQLVLLNVIMIKVLLERKKRNRVEVYSAHSQTPTQWN